MKKLFFSKEQKQEEIRKYQENLKSENKYLSKIKNFKNLFKSKPGIERKIFDQISFENLDIKSS